MQHSQPVFSKRLINADLLYQPPSSSSRLSIVCLMLPKTSDRTVQLVLQWLGFPGTYWGTVPCSLFFFFFFLCRWISVWDKSTCPFLMIKTAATVSHCHSPLTKRREGERMKYRSGSNMCFFSINWWGNQWVDLQGERTRGTVSLSGCVCDRNTNYSELEKVFFFLVLLERGLILPGCLGDVNIRTTTQRVSQRCSILTDFLSSRSEKLLSTLNSRGL